MSYTINYNPAKNRIIVTVQKIDESNADQYIKDFTEVLKQTKPGFTGCTDVTESSVLSQEVSQKLAPTMELALNKGLTTTKKWAYVTNNPVYKMQWRRMFKDSVEYCETLAEADAYLDRP
ncbi:hypothetical protein KIH86_27190 [Paenibacillus sp. HN-1]|uniref:hypothetical protein n=1 Tax=Paenibacillus TaxID=44249 RepID=UPI001CA910F5|nr:MULTISPECIES: hypothetical protein [Paenibacillus]MBY9078406.1 hypothetical protein [Paenibacillus sp. CGMCC 1.18879]MBY9087879.1 hypothetical protein [Paenibacillus sinensis]